MAHFKNIFLVLMLASTTVIGQQLPQFSQFHRNQGMSNPGAIGAYDFMDITLGSRYQWLGFNNDMQGNVAPRSAYLNFATTIQREPVRHNPSLRTSVGPIRNPELGTGKLKHGIGGQFIADEYGAFRQLAFSGTYAIHVPVTEKVNISLGARIGASNHTFLSEKAQVLSHIEGTATDQTYENFTNNGYSRMFMDISTGLYVYSNRFFIGITGNQLTQHFVSFGSGNTNFNPVMHFDLMGGVTFNLNEDITLLPALSLKYMNPANPVGQLNIQTEYKEWLWLGLGFRYKDAAIVMAGANINERFKIGYSFDYSTSRMNNFTAGGHEVVLGLMFR
ncbi:MAG: PorP/SprF family type IX secretion system membrane protein [Brumimicrobium sp.]|nr:PorP/SprF family type IX secretion system membrane protein [Brumimicrobium sp.]